ncbi:hypothetical protein BDW74DRAFT_178447 [Aspergillus multicolor]|uniref:uncharacterized protein n=1 Tax=Aspergillus multicolor TaxID=41759 RepID=UPI003CCCC5B9
MASLSITEDSIPSLEGKAALITGGSSGIGHAAALILLSKGATVHILDTNPPPEPKPDKLNFHSCNITSRSSLLSIFTSIGAVDYVFANAGVSESTNYFVDTFDSNGGRKSRATMSLMSTYVAEGSIVVTSSATAYAPEQSLPVYAAGKSALIGLIRSLRSVIMQDSITINGVAPAATVTSLLPPHLAAPIMAAGLPVSTAHFVGLALLYSATATQARKVEVYGKEEDKDLYREERWNCRVTLTLGDSYTELEEGISDLRPWWFGRGNLGCTRMQKTATDCRESS